MSPRSKLPPGAIYANYFALFNAISWQITLGSPAILYAKSLGASATVLGVIAALTPLLVILQIPAAHLLPRYGYRKFILAGWGSRTVCIFGLAIVPMLTFLDATSKLVLVLLLLFVFNLLRGMASGAWLPWISQIIPAESRARFLSRDQMFAQAGCLISLSMAALTLSAEPRNWQFALVFLFSALGATASLYFINRVPDVTATEQLRASGTPVPWAHMLVYRPFLKLTAFNLLFVCATGGIGVFTIDFLRSVVGLPERQIVALSTLAVIGSVLTLPWMARLLDITGSRRVIAICLATISVVLCGWFLVASHLVGFPIIIIGTLMMLGGVAAVNYNVANNRLAMAVMPEMGKNHFFALFTVITNMAAGLSPIGWGLMLDGLKNWNRMAGPVQFNRYSLFYALAFVPAVAAALYAISLPLDKGNYDVASEPHTSGTSPLAVGGVPTAVRREADKF